jgi:hypothetical protein
MTDEDEIKKFIAERGVTVCPPQPAAILGETTPGWRRNAERRTEKSHQSKRRDRLQNELAARQEGKPLPFRGRGRPLSKKF